jgi:hypothetical protein
MKLTRAMRPAALLTLLVGIGFGCSAFAQAVDEKAAQALFKDN